MKKYLLLCFLVLASNAFAQNKPSEKFNVLFIAVDDLRPELGCYGVSGVKSPNIDALAKSGLLFNRAYCQQAVCSPSRTSLLTGRRPDTTKIYNLEDHFRQTIPDVVTLPQHFKNNGYFAQSFGKIYHGGLDDPQSWSTESVGAVGTGKGRKKVSRKIKVAGKGAAWESPDVPDNALGDGETADAAIKVLHNVKDKPFFLAVGFKKPHLPFIAPKKYFDLYRTEDMQLAKNPFPPKDVFPIALTDWGELRGYKGIPQDGPIPDKMARELKHAYYAATSYTDAQIGRVLDELQKLGLREKTIVILWGDHGWQLGEHGLWCKHTNFEIATRSTLMISAPDQKKRGAKTDALVEFVDIYPSLCELAGLPSTAGLEGKSFVPLMEDPKREWKTAAFSQYPRGKLMGYAMRTDRYRYIEWAEKGKAPEGIELYDHKRDPEENVNVAKLPENKKLVAQLSEQLKKGWKAAAEKN
ncbi:MAG: sulfatase [Verrucomicrobiota bacterium]